AFNGRERDRKAASLLFQHLTIECLEVLQRIELVRNPLKQVGQMIFGDFPQQSRMFRPQGLQPYIAAFQ
ncbi:MAG: hypothetical protein DMG94_12095, partial [Acidobacteria bacterium]